MRETSFFVAQNPPFAGITAFEPSIVESPELDKNMYEDNLLEIQGESDRLRSLTFPSIISEEMLGFNIKDRIIVDIGAGSSTDLYEYSTLQGATYVPVDIHEDFLHVHREGGGIPVVSDIDKLPFVDNSINITHARFILSWLSDSSKRSKAIQECLRVARERSLFLDYDWTSFDGSENVLEFKDAALEILLNSGFDPYYGKKLMAEVEQETTFPHTLHVTRKNEGLVNDTSEFIKMGIPLAAMARSRLNRPDLADKMTQCVQDLANHDVVFTRPDIVGVEIRKESDF